MLALLLAKYLLLGEAQTWGANVSGAGDHPEFEQSALSYLASEVLVFICLDLQFRDMPSAF